MGNSDIGNGDITGDQGATEATPTDTDQSSIIRKEVAYTPYNGERVAINTTIWRFNFGWLKTVRTIAFCDEDLPKPGEGEFEYDSDDEDARPRIADEAAVRLQGESETYYENTIKQPLPASLEFPSDEEDRLKDEMTSEDHFIAPTYEKIGNLCKISVFPNLYGEKPRILELSEIPYGIKEYKSYDAQIYNDDVQAEAQNLNPPDGFLTDITFIEAEGVGTLTKATG